MNDVNATPSIADSLLVSNDALMIQQLTESMHQLASLARYVPKFRLRWSSGIAESSRL